MTLEEGYEMSLMQFLTENLKDTNKEVIIQEILKLVSDDEYPGFVYELSGNKLYKLIFLTSKQILIYHSDKSKILIDSIYFKDITGYNLKYAIAKRREHVKNEIENVEIKLVNKILEIEFNDDLQDAQSLEEQKSNSLELIKTLNRFIK